MPEHKFVQLTGNSTMLMHLVNPELAAEGARIPQLWIMISHMQLFYITCFKMLDKHDLKRVNIVRE